MIRRTGTSRFGEPWIWLGAAAVALALLLVFGVLTLIAIRGLGHFWPAPLEEIRYADVSGRTLTLLGSIVETETLDRAVASVDPGLGLAAADPSMALRRELLRTGNRDLAAPDFRWLDSHRVQHRHRPADAVALERMAWGNAYGYLETYLQDGAAIAGGAGALPELRAGVERARRLRDAAADIRGGRIARLSDRLEDLRMRDRSRGSAAGANPVASIEGARLATRIAEAEAELRAVESDLGRDAMVLRLADGSTHLLPLATVIRIWQPNDMSTLDRVLFYLGSVVQFVTGSPREANTEGGIFPAIFGTVLLVMLMAFMVTPLGVIAAVYLHEYARPGPGVRALRIAVNNLAGVPSIVYGVFGLGFFVYVIGGSIDELLFAHRLPSATFGSPGLLWSALTLALLTVPVVIVSTEEGLMRIPREIREGALALGATRSETLWRVVLPSATPAILTGVILAVARAAGEVAPLMLVGVVKLAPALPVDTVFPYLHLDRQFMHLGFHIYDVGFQSPNVEAARPLVYATALLLVLIIVSLNLVAIVLRNRLYRRYGGADA